MKKQYAISLSIIVIMLTISLSLTTSYGLWKIEKNHKDASISENGCFEIVYNNQEEITANNFKPLNEDNGKTSTPYTIAITNKCDTEKTAELRLNIKETSTLNLKGLTIYLDGDIDVIPTKYNDLKNSRSTMTGLTNTKIVGNIVIPSNSTIRSNIRLWIDEKVVGNVNQEEQLNAILEVTDKESIILPTFKETLLENNGGEEFISSKIAPSYDSIANTNDGLYKTTDNDGTSYYFRGNVDNNYVSFADKLWRIVRINGDDTIRLILQSEEYPRAAFNTTKNQKDYAGYTYTLNDNIESSNIKNTLEAWYQENITNNNYDDYVANSLFYNDTNSYILSWKFYFNTTSRLVDDRIPSLLYTATDKTYGGIYKQKVGLINADEISLAGGKSKTANNGYYLYTGRNYYTMSPSDFSSYSAYEMIVSEDGSIKDSIVNVEHDVRPVISLKSTISVNGDGTINNPYIIDTE